MYSTDGKHYDKYKSNTPDMKVLTQLSSFYSHMWKILKAYKVTRTMCELNECTTQIKFLIN